MDSTSKNLDSYRTRHSLPHELVAPKHQRCQVQRLKDTPPCIQVAFGTGWQIRTQEEQKSLKTTLHEPWIPPVRPSLKMPLKPVSESRDWSRFRTAPSPTSTLMPWETGDLLSHKEVFTLLPGPALTSLSWVATIPSAPPPSHHVPET